MQPSDNVECPLIDWLLYTSNLLPSPMQWWLKLACFCGSFFHTPVSKPVSWWFTIHTAKNEKLCRNKTEGYGCLQSPYSNIPYKATVESSACLWGVSAFVFWTSTKSGLQEQAVSKNSRSWSQFTRDVDRIWDTSTGVQPVTHKEGRILIGQANYSLVSHPRPFPDSY